MCLKKYEHFFFRLKVFLKERLQKKEISEFLEKIKNLQKKKKKKKTQKEKERYKKKQKI